MKNILKLLAMFAFAAFVITACSDDDDNPTNTNPTLIDAVKVINIETTNTQTGDSIAYYSLKDNKIIPSSESNTTKWDVAFHRTNIYVNCGSKGPGQGGGFVLKGADFASLGEVPAASVFNIEEESTRAIATGSGNGWYTYNPATHEIAATPGNIIMIRTADGKYAKMEILSYYLGYPDSIPSDVMLRTDKTYSFKFVYQPDGSKSFKK